MIMKVANLNSAKQAGRIEAQGQINVAAQVWRHLLGNLGLFPLKPSADWMKPTYVTKSNLYSKSTDPSIHLLWKISSQYHLDWCLTRCLGTMAWPSWHQKMNHHTISHSHGQQLLCPQCTVLRSRMHVCVLSHVRLFTTPWIVAHQLPLSKGFSRQKYWSGLLCPPPGDLPNLGIESVTSKSPASQILYPLSRATWEALY